jgi:MOSC domain-containing protein YiiM
MASVTHIFLAPARGAPMQSVHAVEAVADQGLRGDRYIEAKVRREPDQQVTLIELESIEAFARETGLAMTPGMPRRNIVTQGVRLNDLCGRRFTVGEVVLEGLELCEPCRLFAKRTHREALQFFAGRGGLRARIVAGGQVRVGDALSVKT